MDRRIATLIRKAADEVDGESFVVVVMLPDEVVAQFPPTETPDVAEQMPPHITVVYAKLAADELAAAEEVVHDVCATFETIEVLIGGLAYFDHPDQRVAYVQVDAPRLADLRKNILAGLAAAGIGALQTHPGFTPHATIAYLKTGEDWTGAVPAGSFSAAQVDIWLREKPSSTCTLGWPKDMADGPPAPGQPFLAEHAVRQAPPGKFVRYARTHPDGWPAGVDAVMGIRRDKKSEIQSVRFDRATWTVARAREWLRDHGFSAGGFEVAAGKSCMLGHLQPDVRTGGGMNEDVTKSIDELVAKAKGLDGDSRKALADALTKAADTIRKGDEAAADAATGQTDAEKAAATEAKTKADAERAATEKAATAWPLDLARSNT